MYGRSSAHSCTVAQVEQLNSCAASTSECSAEGGRSAPGSQLCRMPLCSVPLLQDEDLLVQYYPYLRGGKDIYSCADEQRVGRICPARAHLTALLNRSLPRWSGNLLRPLWRCSLPWLPGSDLSVAHVLVLRC